jgi:hypothetical protein
MLTAALAAQTLPDYGRLLDCSSTGFLCARHDLSSFSTEVAIGVVNGHDAYVSKSLVRVSFPQFDLISSTQICVHARLVERFVDKLWIWGVAEFPLFLGESELCLDGTALFIMTAKDDKMRQTVFAESINGVAQSYWQQVRLGFRLTQRSLAMYQFLSRAARLRLY